MKLLGVFPGQMAPQFDAETLDGKKIKLADYRGKLVLIQFWATTSEASTGELATIKKARDKYKDKTLAVVSVSFDLDAAAAKSYAAGNGMDWPQIWVEGAEKSKLAQLYQVSKVPALFLIGRDGKIAATDLRGAKLLPAIEKELNKDKE